MGLQSLFCLWEGLGALLTGTCMKVPEGKPGTFTRKQATAVKSVTQIRQECSTDNYNIRSYPN